MATYDNRFQAKMSPEEKQMLRDLAASRGCGMSEVVRQLIDERYAVYELAQRELRGLREYFDGACPACKGHKKAEPLPQEMSYNFSDETRMAAYRRWNAGPDCPVCSGTGER